MVWGETFPTHAFFFFLKPEFEMKRNEFQRSGSLWILTVKNEMGSRGLTPGNTSPMCSGDSQHRGRDRLSMHVEDGTEYSL